MVAGRKSIYGFTEYRRLQEYARTPYDLTADDALVRDERLERYQVLACGMKLLYGTERLDDRTLGSLQTLADSCDLVGQFNEMRRGKVMNRVVGADSENRQVLHCATRDIFSATPKEPNLSRKVQAELDKLQIFLGEVASGGLTSQCGQSFQTIVQVGIGGSDLGPRAVYEALKAYALAGRSARFISNVDPDDVSTALDGLDLSTTLFAVVSKSGSTLETVTNEAFVRRTLLEHGLDPAQHCIAITGEGSPMDNPDHYLASFYIYDAIGGRYSTTSMVGAVLLGFVLGWQQLLEFLRGAHEMDEHANERELRRNIPLLLAMLGIWNRNFLGYASLAVIPYSQALYRFPAHLQQCDMESNGKSVDRQGNFINWDTGPILWGETGSNSQHAFFQHIYQGTSPVPIEFIGFAQSQRGRDIVVQGCTSQQKLLANLFAQMVALATGKDDANPNRYFAGNRPSCLLFAKKLTPYLMGALLSCYEAKIVFQGFAWNINSFDQEGVQFGKDLAQKFMIEIEGGVEHCSGVEGRFLREVERGI